jgi:hypothetical protein
MSALADRSAKRKRAAALEVPGALAALEVARLVDHLDALFLRHFLECPPRERALPSVPAGNATFAALCFRFGAEHGHVFINLDETRTITEADSIRAFLRDAMTVAEAHYRLRKLGELATLRALLGAAVPAPLGRGYGPVLWYTMYGLQIEYGRNTDGGFRFPSPRDGPRATARISVYAPGRVPLTADELAAKITLGAPTSPPAEPEPEPEAEPREPWATWTYMPGPRTWDLRKAPLFARTAQPGDPPEAHAEAEAADQALAQAQADADAQN